MPCAPTTTPAPYASALWTSIAAAILAVLPTAAWGCTFGVLASWLFGATVSTAASVLMGLGVTAEVYRRRLATGSGHALLIAIVEHTMAWGIRAVLWGLLGWLR